MNFEVKWCGACGFVPFTQDYFSFRVFCAPVLGLFSSVLVKSVIRILIAHWINRTLGVLDILTVLFLLIWKHGVSFPFTYSSSFFHHSFVAFCVVVVVVVVISYDKWDFALKEKCWIDYC